MPQEQIKAQFGKVTEMIGGGWLQVQPGEGTDETALLLATAYGIMKILKIHLLKSARIS